MMMMMIVKPMLIMTGADGDGNVRNGTDDQLIMREAEGVLMSDFNECCFIIGQRPIWDRS